MFWAYYLESEYFVVKVIHGVIILSKLFWVFSRILQALSDFLYPIGKRFLQKYGLWVCELNLISRLFNWLVSYAYPEWCVYTETISIFIFIACYWSIMKFKWIIISVVNWAIFGCKTIFLKTTVNIFSLIRYLLKIVTLIQLFWAFV
jgi:hypothetical protein